MNRELVINREWRSSFLAGGMTLTLKGTCTPDDLLDAAKVLELAMAQIKREYAAETALPGGESK